MIQTYRMAAKAFAGTFPTVITISFILAFVKQFLPDTSLGGGLIALAFMAFFAHRAILLGETHNWSDAFRTDLKNAKDLKPLPFFWRMFVWWGFGTGIWIGLFIAQKSLVFGPGNAITSDEVTGLFIVSLALTVVFALPFLAAFGSMLPAAAIGENAGVSAAWRRGRRRFWPTLGRLWGGNVLFFVLCNGLLLWLVPETGNPGVDAALQIPFELVGIFAIYLTAAALSLGYTEAEGTDPRAADHS